MFDKEKIAKFLKKEEKEAFDYELYSKLMKNIKDIPSDRFIEKSVMRSTALNICAK